MTNHALKRLLDNEPTAIAGAVRALILCAVAFGLQWTPEQIAAVMLALEMILTLYTRSKVAPIDGPQNIDTKIAARMGPGEY